METRPQGILVIIGGGEDKKGACTILKTVAELAGGDKGKLVILTAATEFPQKVGREYTELFGKFNIKSIDAVHIEIRADAGRPERLERIAGASCIFFTGGDQLRITSLIGGTETERVLKDAFQKGAVIAGTSAGASVMSQTMITSGDDDQAPKKCTLKMAPGLGLISGVVIDQHFAQRGRIGRLMTAIAQNPMVLGIGIDEDTAIVLHPDQTFEVIGSNAVTILDAIACRHTNVSELQPDEILAMTGITLHILPQGFRFDIHKRSPELRRQHA